MENLYEAYDILKDCRPFYIATVENGEPKVRPFGAVAWFEDRIYIQTGAKKDVARQIKNNPHIEICAFFSGKWMRIAAIARHDNRLEAETFFLDSNPRLKNRYQPGDGNNEVYRLESGVVRICSLTEPEQDFSF